MKTKTNIHIGTCQGSVLGPLLFFFSGMYDIAVEGDWRWVDCWANPSWTFYNWDDGQPDNGGMGGNEDCAVIQGTNGYFQDLPCSTPRLYICETGTESK